MGTLIPFVSNSPTNGLDMGLLYAPSPPHFPDSFCGVQKGLKNRPRRAAMKAVEIPITRRYHYICSDDEILVQLCVTYSVVQISTRLTLRRVFCSAEHWI